jgi:hypothetical protein
MLKQKLVLITSLAAALLVPAISFAAPATTADSAWRYVGGEQGWAYDSSQASASSAPQRDSAQPVEQGIWRFVGGEVGWTATTAEYEFVGGRIVHAEQCAFKPQLASNSALDLGKQPLPEYLSGA